MADQSARTALVTGAAGFIGSHLSEALVRRGWSVIGVDNLFRGRMENLHHLCESAAFEFHRLDLTSSENLLHLRRIVAQAGVDTVFHYAAINGTQYFYDRPREVIRRNGDMTAGLLDAITASPDLRKIVFASSSEVYGSPRSFPTDEEQAVILRPLIDRDSYAASKVLSEFEVRMFAEATEIEWLVLRIFNTYGERMVDSKYGQVIPEFIRKITEDDVFGIIGDGQHRRSFCYVGDHVRMVAEAADQATSTVLNVGNPEEVTMYDLAKRLHRIMGREFAPHFLPERVGDHRRRVPDISRLRDITGLVPEVGLDAGLERCVRYHLTRGTARESA